MKLGKSRGRNEKNTSLDVEEQWLARQGPPRTLLAAFGRHHGGVDQESRVGIKLMRRLISVTGAPYSDSFCKNSCISMSLGAAEN